MKYIYHIHDVICGHATNTLDQVVQIALKNKYKELFYTEHCPLDNNHHIFRPNWNEIANLRKNIDLANQKYRGQLKIHFGLEAEFSKWNPIYFTNLKNNKLIDYMIFGNHYLGDMWRCSRWVGESVYDQTDLKEYLANAELALKSKLFSLFAHPDIWLGSYRKWDKHAQWLTEKLISLCEKYDMPMGFNANGMATIRDGFNYPAAHFWKVVAHSNVKVLIEADSHSPIILSKAWLNKTKKEAIKLGLKKNLVEQIKIHYFHH